MITHLKNVPENVAAFAVRAGVTIQDFRTAIIPEVHKLIMKYGEINFLLELDADVPDFTRDRSFTAFLLELKNVGSWNRFAVVSDSASIIILTSSFVVIKPQKFKSFAKDLYGEASKWVSQSKD